MRILHTSDWHLGRTFHGQVLDDAHAAFADHLVELVAAESVDAVLVSGDVYDRAVPPAACVTLLDETLRRLTERTRVVMTPGNHDSAHRLGFAADLMRDRLLIRARTAGLDRGIVLPDASGREAAIVHALPYLDPDAAREALPPLLAQRLGERTGPPDDAADGQAPGAGEEPGDGDAGPRRPARLPRSHEAVVAAALRLVAADLGRRRAGRGERLPSVLMAHAFVVGGTASQSERDIRVGGVDAVPSQVFATMGGSPAAQASGGLDYVALGHLHRPQELRPPRAEPGAATDQAAPAACERAPRLVYSGSPIALSFDEADAAKSSVLLDIGPEGVTGLERIAVPVRHRVRTLEGGMDQLLATPDDGSWVRIILSGERPPSALARLKAHFPGLLAFSHQAPERPRGERVAVTAAADPLEISAGFLDDVGQRAPSRAEREVLRLAYESALAAGRSRQ
ncbi:metallophosphoesterase family protein [Actinomyces bowdenii]|uniref:Nuclease SbcCD subunit D n=1 Tax=Actinomyces bowdenii TaxID=131109 RepID=A0A853EIY1_9ACTO|nr:exonuclease subunit SbcD [Actinomyces bowdenii]MBF0697154.1 exonuclease subunit SbcD [Actinomyces bowdenii]NYS69327.1 exonuclease subunit SbcD [Actinomyces bowdenii]